MVGQYKIRDNDPVAILGAISGIRRRMDERRDCQIKACFFVDHIERKGLFPFILAVLKCFGQVFSFDGGFACKICNCAGKLKHTVISTGCETKLTHGGFHQAASGFVQNAVLADLFWGHVSIVDQACSLKAFDLDLTSLFNSCPDCFRGLTTALVAQFLVIDPGDVQVDIDPVQ